MTLNKFRLWDHLTGIGMMFTGYAVGHNLTFIRDTSLDPLAFVAGMALWGAGIVGVKYQERYGDEPDEQQPERPATEARRIPNLNETPNGFQPIGNLTYETAVKSVKLEKRDPRIVQWAYAVAYNNAPMKQTKWCGGKRLFSKPEYGRWIACLLEKEIITFANPKNPAGGYKPNGARGWQKIKDIADTRAYIPLPAATMTEAGARFVSARVREGLRVGEGTQADDLTINWSID
jgi:hypothetical protein